MANSNAGRCVKGNALTNSVSAGVSRATSVSTRYLIDGDACAISQSSGMRTGLGGSGGDGGAATCGATGGATGPVCAAEGGGTDTLGVSELFDGDGRVTRGSQS